MHPPIVDSHLSDEELEALHQRYLAGEKPGALIKEHGLAITPSQFPRLFPPMAVEGTCRRCSGPLVKQRASFTQHRAGYRPTPYCKMCGHREKPECGCEECLRERVLEHRQARDAKALAQAARRSKIQARIAAALPRTADECRGADPRALLALAADLKWRTQPIDPRPDDLVEAYQRYGERDGLIVADLTASSLEAFDDDGMPVEGRREDIRWQWNVDANVDLDTVIGMLHNALSGRHEDLATIWIDIMTDETGQFLANQLKQVHLPTGKILAPILKVIAQLQRETSCAYICKYIFQAIKDAAKYARMPRCTSEYEAVGAIATYLESHHKNQLGGKYHGIPFKRPFEYRRSALNRVFFNDVLGGVGDIGFEECAEQFLPRTPLWKYDLSQTLSHVPVCADCGSQDVVYAQGRMLVQIRCRVCGEVRGFATGNA